MGLEIIDNKKTNEELNIEDIVEIKPVETDKKTDEEIDNCVSTSPSSRIHTIKFIQKLCLEKGIDFCKIVNQHCCLLTKDFCKTNVPKCCKSKWVGYTSFLYISPYFFVPGNGIFAKILKILYILQGPISHASDYTWHNINNVSHGMDRWLATSLVGLSVYMSLRYIGFIQTILLGSVPLSFLYLAKKASVTNNEKQYNFTQTLWHLTSPFIASYVLYKVGKKGIEF